MTVIVVILIVCLAACVFSLTRSRGASSDDGVEDFQRHLSALAPEKRTTSLDDTTDDTSGLEHQDGA